jgi:hypothetical protein
MWSKYKYKIYWVGLIPLHLQVFNALLSLFCAWKKKKKTHLFYNTFLLLFLFILNFTLHHLQHKPIFHFIQQIILVTTWWSGDFHGMAEPPINLKFLY